MKIEVVGTGCAKCRQLHEIVKRVAAEIGPDASVRYVSDQAGIQRLIELGLMSSPALLVNDKIAMVGVYPGVEQIKGKILETAGL